jgi:hypothetical protein
MIQSPLEFELDIGALRWDINSMDKNKLWLIRVADSKEKGVARKSYSPKEEGNACVELTRVLPHCFDPLKPSLRRIPSCLSVPMTP